MPVYWMKHRCEHWLWYPMRYRSDRGVILPNDLSVRWVESFLEYTIDFGFKMLQFSIQAERLQRSTADQ
jgi:hypothetical protein